VADRKVTWPLLFNIGNFGVGTGDTAMTSINVQASFTQGAQAWRLPKDGLRVCGGAWHLKL